MIQRHYANRSAGWSAPFVAAMTFLVLTASGCAPQADVAPDEVIDLAAEEAAIRQMYQDRLVAINQHGEAGAEGYASFLTEDAVYLPPNVERLDGRDAAAEFVLLATAADGWYMSWEVNRIEISASADLAYAVGAWESSMKDPDGNTVEDKGNFLNALRKQADGSWRVASVMFNSDLPLDIATE